MLNSMTVDLEDWRQLVHLKLNGDTVPPDPMIVRETELLLTFFASRGVRATFFVLSNVAESFPDLIRRIDGAGHEVASHGLSHARVYAQSPEEFKLDAVRSKEILEQTIGKLVRGYRAPEFSITKESWWALDILAEAGYEYDSSVFPLQTRRYGIPDFPPGPTKVSGDDGRTILEVPMSTLQVIGRKWPVAGGGYMHILPYRAMGRTIRQANEGGRAAVIYLHPYDFSDARLRVPLKHPSLKTYLVYQRHSSIHNFARGRVRGTLEKLTKDFSFGTIGDLIGALRGSEPHL